jgi:hypothetical protein
VITPGSFQECVSPAKRKETTGETNRPAAMPLAPGVETGTTYETLLPIVDGTAAHAGPTATSVPSVERIH